MGYPTPDPNEKMTEIRCTECKSFVHARVDQHPMSEDPFIKLECNCSVHIISGSYKIWVPADEYTETS